MSSKQFKMCITRSLNFNSEITFGDEGKVNISNDLLRQRKRSIMFNEHTFKSIRKTDVSFRFIVRFCLEYLTTLAIGLGGYFL